MSAGLFVSVNLCLCSFLRGEMDAFLSWFWSKTFWEGAGTYFHRNVIWLIHRVLVCPEGLSISSVDLLKIHSCFLHFFLYNSSVISKETKKTHYKCFLVPRLATRCSWSSFLAATPQITYAESSCSSRRSSPRSFSLVLDTVCLPPPFVLPMFHLHLIKVPRTTLSQLGRAAG